MLTWIVILVLTGVSLALLLVNGRSGGPLSVGRQFTRRRNPVEYWFHVLLMVAIAIWSIVQLMRPVLG